MADVESSSTNAIDEQPQEQSPQPDDNTVNNEDVKEVSDADEPVQSDNRSPQDAEQTEADAEAEAKKDESAEKTSCDDDASYQEDQQNESSEGNEPVDESEKTNLIINYLPQQMTDEEFQELFKKFGEMKSCKIVRNKNTGASYGFGFVDFETHEQAIAAIEGLNGHELDNKKIKVAFARPAGRDIKQANLYVKNVPATWTEDDLRKIFEPYGKIIQVRVPGNNRNIAFVLYDLRKQAQDALDAINGKTLDGCEQPLEVKFSTDKVKGENKPNSTSTGDQPRGKKRGHRGGVHHNAKRRRAAAAAAAAAAGNANGDATGSPNTNDNRSSNDNSMNNKNNSNNNYNNNNNNNRNNNNYNNQNNFNQRNNRGGSFFDRQNQDRRRNDGFRGQNQYHNSSNNNQNNYINNNQPMPYGMSNQYNNMNGMRNAQQMRNMPRFAPFVAMPGAMGPIVQPPSMIPNPAAFGYVAPQLAQQQQQQQQQPIQQQQQQQQAQMQQPQAPTMIPYAGLMPQQAALSAAMQPVSQTATAATQMTPMSMYGAVANPMAAAQMSAYAMSMNPSAMSNMYSVASSQLNNAANMQLGQQSSNLRNNNQSSYGGTGGGGGGGGSGGDGVTLFVYNLGPDDDENDLRSMFAPYGQIVKCIVIRKTPGGESKGYGFVTVKDSNQAQAAISNLNGSTRRNRTLQVSLKK